MISLHRYVEAAGLQSLVMGASKDPNAKITVLLVSPATRRAVLAVKVPTTDAAARAVAAEARVLDMLWRAGGVDETVPRVVDEVEFLGRPGLVTTAVEGLPMSTAYLRWRHTARPWRVRADFASVERWLARLHDATAGPAAALDMDAGVATQLATRFDGEPGLEADLDRLAEVHAALARSMVPRTAVHGDLWCGNVLLTGPRASGVVDWEAGAAAGEPVRDLVRFALMYALFLDRRTRPGRPVPGHRALRAVEWGAGVGYALDGVGWFPDVFRRFLQEGLARLGARPETWRDAVLAGIAEVAAVADDHAFARRHLDLFRRVTRRNDGPRPFRSQVNKVRSTECRTAARPGGETL